MNTQMSHDKFFRHSFSQLEIAADFLAQYLPTEMVDLLDLDQMVLEQGSFIDNEMKGHHVDLLYTIPLKELSGELVSAYFLFEHKAQPDNEIGFQLLRYMVNIWEEQKRNQIERRPIIPIVIYHGEKRWTAGESFQESHRFPEPFRPYVPNFRYIFRDFSPHSDMAIRGGAWLTACLTTMHVINDPHLQKKLVQLVQVAAELRKRELGVEYFWTILYYVSQATDRIDRQDLYEALLTQGDTGDDDMATIAQAFRQEGFNQGLEEGIDIGREEGIDIGREEGRQQALRHSIINILMLRFGASPDGLADKLDRLSDLNILEELTAYAAVSASITDFLGHLDKLES